MLVTNVKWQRGRCLCVMIENAGKILSATVDHVIVYEKTGEHVLSENVNMETAIVSYSKEQISGDNLGT